MKNFISQSKEMTTEYCATVVRLGEVKPIEGSDFLGVVEVEGRDIVVRKDSVHEGDVMIYISNECQLCREFLYRNNEFADSELNANYDWLIKEIEKMKANNATPEEIDSLIKSNRGYFNKNGRVRMMKLRGVMSMGYLIKPISMCIYKKELDGFNWENHIGEDFDTVLDELFVKAYVPEVKERRVGKGHAEKKVKRFDRMIPGQFAFHYDTQQLQKNMDIFTPNTSVCISVKEHGTSAIFGNVKVKNPRWGGLYTKVFNYLPSFLQFTKEDYDVVYSSRQVVKNADLNPSVTGGFYSVDVWNDYYQILKDIIPEGMTVYGEIVGYLTGENRGIQSLGGKVYDYGCKPGENKLMIYRITQKDEGGTYEWDMNRVMDFTLDLIDILAELDDRNGTHNATRIAPVQILFDGLLRDLYPGICKSEVYKNALKPRKADKNEDEHTKCIRESHNNVLKAELAYMNEWLSQDHSRDELDFISQVASKDSIISKAWRDAVLSTLKTDPGYYMEMDEPMCANKLPREGIVIRINGDKLPEAFKLKTLAFLGKEAKDVDAGKADVEMAERY